MSKYIKRFHILSHYFMKELSGVKAFVDCHDCEFLFNVNYQYKNRHSYDGHNIELVPCSVLVMLDEDGSFLMIEGQQLSVDFEYIENFDFKNLNGIPIVLKEINCNFAVRKATLIPQHIQEGVKLCKDIQSRGGYPIAFINKEHVKIIKRINLSMLNGAGFKNIQELHVIVDTSDASEIPATIECINSIPDTINLGISAIPDRLKLLSKNEKIALKLRKLQELEVNCLRQFTYSRRQAKEEFLIRTNEYLYGVKAEIKELNCSAYGHSNCAKKHKNCLIQERGNMIKDLLVPFI